MVHLAASASAAPAAAEPAGGLRLGGRPGLALVVEDEALLALEIESILAAEGFETRIACTPEDALALEAEDAALAVVNLRLVDALRGPEIIRVFRRRRPHLPVVVVTGYGPAAPQADLRGLGGPTARLQKPVAAGALRAAARDVIARGATG
ncbi:response regulator, partial [Paracraurococcus ruber]